MKLVKHAIMAGHSFDATFERAALDQNYSHDLVRLMFTASGYMSMIRMMDQRLTTCPIVHCRWYGNAMLSRLCLQRVEIGHEEAFWHYDRGINLRFYGEVGERNHATLTAVDELFAIAILRGVFSAAFGFAPVDLSYELVFRPFDECVSECLSKSGTVSESLSAWRKHDCAWQAARLADRRCDTFMLDPIKWGRAPSGSQ